MNIMNNDNGETEILDAEIDLGVFVTAEESEDAFERWKQEEYFDEYGTTEGVYLGDGVYG
jgi:hypothetical protein